MYFRETNCVIHWIVIYPADSVIQLFKQLSPGKTRAKIASATSTYGVTFHSLNTTGTRYGDAMLEQVIE